jgi:predicted TIM-barrel fold metal-dependent hydrolase
VIVDFHNHYYPPAYLDALKQGDSTVRVTEDDAGNPVLHYPGDYNVAVRGHRDIAYRAAELERLGVDTQVLTLTTPGTHVEHPARAMILARLVNDAFATVVRESRGRFTALATLPLNDPDASVAELRRAVDKLGFRGAMLFSNVNGVALADERFEPLYRAANELRAVLHIHPTAPVGVAAMTEYWLMPLVGFPPTRHWRRRISCSPVCPSGIRESPGCWGIWAARYPILRSVWIAAFGRSPSAARASRGRRASTCAGFTWIP